MIRVFRPTAARFCAAFALIVGLCAAAPSAHKTVVSTYTFYHDVEPILQARCAACHRDDGIAFPMASYAQVKLAAWQIQQSLISGRMPIWDGDPQAAPFKGSRAIAAKELNVVMTWAAGSTPEGLPVPVSAHRPAPPAVGAPSTILEMPEPFTLTADRREADREVVWPAGGLEGQWMTAADVVPGAPSIVHHASVAIRSQAGEQVVSLWIPGDAPQPLSGGGAFHVPAGASIVLRIHYQRRPDDASAVVDRSRIRLYRTTPAAARSVGAIVIEGAGEWPYNTTRVFTRTVDARVSIAAIRPIAGPIDSRVSLTLIGTDGRRVPLARVVLRPEWPRRYVFVTPVVVPPGSRVEAAVTASYGVAFATLTGDRGIGPAEGGPLRLVLETVP